MNEGKKNKKDILPWISISTQVVTVISMIFIFIFWEKKNKELNNYKLKIETEILPREFENNLRLTLYKEVKEAIEKKDSSLQNATLLIVNEMLDKDSIFRVKLINILLQSTNSSELQKTQEKLNTYRQEQISQNPLEFTIDVFYLEGISSKAKSLADSVRLFLHTKYPQYKIRKRLLPKSVNASIGYQINHNQIRYDKNSEEEKLAKEIYNEICKKGFFEEQPTPQPINNNTKKYLSIFVRNE